jgi:C1A family cysteine protease
MRDDTPPGFTPGTGFIPSPHDPKDHPLSLYIPRLAEVERELPATRVVYSNSMPLYNQGESSMCVAFSAALASTIDQRRDHRRTIVYDAPELYARCKEQDGIPNIDGTYPRIALDIKRARGIRILSSRIASEVGDLDQIGAYAALRDIEEVKAAIYLFGSAALGSVWYDEWFDIPVSKTFPPGSREGGGHAYLAIGYSDKKQALLIQNSWGPYWGYKIAGKEGRAWLPYSYVHLDSEFDWEAWRSIDLQEN